jgi:peptide/nickel transport system substrate-binding protein
MSLAIDRQSINEFVFLGLGTSSQATIDPTATFFKEEWAEAYASFKPEKAKEMLDEIGLKDTDGNGWRNKPNGEDLIVELWAVAGSDVGASGQKVVELVSGYWKDVGVKTKMKPVSVDLYEQAEDGGNLDVHVFPTQTTMEIRAYSSGGIGYGYALGWEEWFDWKQWKDGGQEGNEPSKGIEPPEHVKRFVELKRKWRSTNDPEEYKELGQEVYDWVANYVPVIGTVGHTPSPAIFQNDLRNVPTKIPFTFETLLWKLAYPEQWYIKK